MRSICLLLVLWGMAAAGLATFGSVARAEDQVNCNGLACDDLDIQYHNGSLTVTLKTDRKVRIQWTASADSTCSSGRMLNVFYVGPPAPRQEYTNSFSCGPAEADYVDCDSPPCPKARYGDVKSKLKDGCDSAGGSWVENPDDSYQCNLRSGEVTKCFPEDPPRCIHTPN